MKIGDIFFALFLIVFVLIPTILVLIFEKDPQTALEKLAGLPLTDNPQLFLLILLLLFITAIIIYIWRGGK